MSEIHLDKLTKIFADGTVAVLDLDLEIQDGEFMVFVGPSGCGKTTALRMIAGLEDSTRAPSALGAASSTMRPPKIETWPWSSRTTPSTLICPSTTTWRSHCRCGRSTRRRSRGGCTK